MTLPPGDFRRVMAAAARSRMTDGQWEVFVLIICGLRNEQIVEILNRSKTAVDNARRAAIRWIGEELG